MTQPVNFGYDGVLRCMYDIGCCLYHVKIRNSAQQQSVLALIFFSARYFNVIILIDDSQFFLIFSLLSYSPSERCHGMEGQRNSGVGNPEI